MAFRDSLPSNAFDWDYRLVEQVKSDVVGVNRFSPKGSPQWSAQCYMTDEFGRRRLHTKRFSVRKYGEREAYELAVSARKAMLEEAEQQELEALKQGKVRATKGSNRHMAGSK